MTWTAGTHGSTYGGNPVACAAALATLDVIRSEHLMENADKVGNVILEGMRDIQTRHDSIREVRGLALMIGVELTDHDTAAAVERRSFEKGLLALGCGDNAIRMSPALNFREDQARTALEVFESAVADVENAGS
jgi:4-aminobutyrate aminotransferase